MSQVKRWEAFYREQSGEVGGGATLSIVEGAEAIYLEHSGEVGGDLP